MIKKKKTKINNDEYVLRDTDSDFILDKSNNEYVLRLRDLDVEDKPREKLIAQGPSVLNLNEVLAIILNTGTRKEEVLSMASRVVKEYGERGIANETDPKRLVRELDIPIVKACQIVASFELGRRYFDNRVYGKIKIRSPKDVFNYVKDMRDLPKEQLRGLYLDSRQQLIYDEVISIGSLTANIAHPREVFQPAILHSAAAVIVVHNHPSGNLKPSRADIDITKIFWDAGRILGIDLLDHVIVTKQTFARIRLADVDKKS